MYKGRTRNGAGLDPVDSYLVSQGSHPFFFFLRLQSATLCLQKKKPISPQWGREIAVDDWPVNCSTLYGDCSERYIGTNVKPHSQSGVGAMYPCTGPLQYVSTKLSADQADQNLVQNNSQFFPYFVKVTFVIYVSLPQSKFLFCHAALHSQIVNMMFICKHPFSALHRTEGM